MKILEGKVAIVTGAGSGVGYGVARALASEGAQIVIANRTRSTGETAAAKIEEYFGDRGARAIYLETDVSQQDSILAMVAECADRYGPPDILINNATPTSGTARIEHMSTQSIEDHLKVNYLGVFWAMQAVFPHMKAAGWGRIITMCSLNGINAHQYTAMYNGSKEASRALTRTAAVEWGRHGITANVLCPFAATPAWDAFEKYDPNGARGILNDNPLRRIGDSEADIGPVVVFLASDQSRYVTGNTIHADGGGHINGVPWKMELPE